MTGWDLSWRCDPKITDTFGFYFYLSRCKLAWVILVILLHLWFLWHLRSVNIHRGILWCVWHWTPLGPVCSVSRTSLESDTEDLWAFSVTESPTVDLWGQWPQHRRGFSNIRPLYREKCAGVVFKLWTSEQVEHKRSQTNSPLEILNGDILCLFFSQTDTVCWGLMKWNVWEYSVPFSSITFHLFSSRSASFSVCVTK